MQKKVLSTLGLILSVVMLAVACGGGDDDEPTPRPTVAPSQTAAPTETAAPTQPSGNGTSAGQIVNVTQTESPYVFKPDAYNFELGKTYSLVFEAPREFHTFNVDELGIEIFINAEESVQQDITPSTAGSFKLYCIPHESQGMVGTVNVS